ncbi:hypothetical protein [uncultured Sphingomonas sp.]|uniref:hypothetical protein n=1 Tax=uncultured Sphingomonas sp. TaxID=158754 RepID=UPI002605C78A|nr:hypothetical protein [uncultured Sphingomonas sp.]
MQQARATLPPITRIIRATLVAGTLDILAATGLTLLAGRRTVSEMLAYVASGPFPGVPVRGLPVALLGLAVHFTLMAVMAAAFVLAADRLSWLRRQPVVAGVAYGLITFAAMNLVVVPLRFGVMPSTLAVETQLFCHIVLVGLPIAFIARR